jgi:maleate isomerase
LWRWVPDDVSLHITRMPYAGLAGEAALVAAMTEAGAPTAVTTSGALLAGLRHLGADRVATVTPYVAELTAGLTTFLAEAGVEVVAATGLGLTSDIWTVPYEVTAQAVRDTDTPDAAAVFISCVCLQSARRPDPRLSGRPGAPAGRAPVRLDLRRNEQARARR